MEVMSFLFLCLDPRGREAVCFQGPERSREGHKNTVGGNVVLVPDLTLGLRDPLHFEADHGLTPVLGA